MWSGCRNPALPVRTREAPRSRPRAKTSQSTLLLLVSNRKVSHAVMEIRDGAKDRQTKSRNKYTARPNGWVSLALGPGQMHRGAGGRTGRAAIRVTRWGRRRRAAVQAPPTKRDAPG